MTTTTINKAVAAADHPILLETAAQLSAAEKSWQGKNTLGIDTEFVRERTYRADLGLVQISDGETAWLVDPVALDDLQPLKSLLLDPTITKVLHSSSEDLEVLFHSTGALPSPMIDTQVACALLGQPLQMGYHNTVKWLFDIEVDKEQTRSNWCKRPLSERQLHYAAMDVVLLPQMVETLRPRLEQAGRWEWLQEDVKRMQAAALKNIDPNEVYLRFASAGRMDDTSLRALRALAAWRENVAIEKNLARGFVISDVGLVNLACTRPESKGAASSIEGIHPRALQRYASQIIATIGQSLGDKSPIYRPEPFNADQNRQIKEMRSLVQDKASELGIEPALLASRKELERLVRAQDSGRPVPDRYQGWRKAVITNDLMAIGR